jgi:hypothetical protein
MALRIDCYAVTDGVQLEHQEAAVLDRLNAHPAVGVTGSEPIRFLGYASADDTDEQLLFDVLALFGERSGQFDAREQGFGVVRASDLGTVKLSIDTVTDDQLEKLGNARTGPGRRWVTTVSSAMATAVELGLNFAWRTRYDRAGSVNDGPDEFPTNQSVS